MRWRCGITRLPSPSVLPVPHGFRFRSVNTSLLPALGISRTGLPRGLRLFGAVAVVAVTRRAPVTSAGAVERQAPNTTLLLVPLLAVVVVKTRLPQVVPSLA